MKSLLDLFKQFTPDEHFDAIKIGMASPATALGSSIRSGWPSRAGPMSARVR